MKGAENLEIPVWKIFQKHRGRRALWIVVYTLCGATFLYQTTDRIMLLRNSPKSASVVLRLADSLEFPAITICPGYAFRKSVSTSMIGLDYFGCPREQSYGCDWVFPWNVYTHNEALIRRCTFKNSVNCLPGAERRGRWERLLTSLGRCFTYKSGESLTLGGDINGLRLSIEPSMSDRVGTPAFNGIRVYIHPVNETPLVETTGINVNVGASVSYALVVKQYEWIYDERENPCVEDSSEAYSKNKCIVKCINDAAMADAKVTCRAPFMGNVNAKICSNRKMCSALWHKFLEIRNDGKFWKNCAKGCPDPCQKLTYTPITSSLGFTRGSNTSLININIYFRDMWLETISEEWDYNLNEFISDTGGSLNLFWGASIILFIQGFDYATALMQREIYRFWNRRFGKGRIASSNVIQVVPKLFLD